MGEIYLVRARLEFGWDFEKGEDEKPPKTLKQLPIEFGPFRLDWSPNSEFYLMDLGWLEPDYKGDLHPDWEYPVSLLYVETKVEVQSGQHPESAADDILEQLEAMLRLFQEGDVCLRRHEYVWDLREGTPKVAIFIRHRPIKAEPATLYRRGAYRMDDETLGKFVYFFNCYWHIIHQASQPLYNAVFRFSSSYERRTLADRLTELMIAMEVLFGDYEYHRYKIPLRCACMLYPLGEARKGAFKTIRELYDDRSRILHGDELELGTKCTEDRVNQFEEHVRRSILKFLELHKSGHPITSGTQLDDLLFFEKK